MGPGLTRLQALAQLPATQRGVAPYEHYALSKCQLLLQPEPDWHQVLGAGLWLGSRSGSGSGSGRALLLLLPGRLLLALRLLGPLRLLGLLHARCCCRCRRPCRRLLVLLGRHLQRGSIKAGLSLQTFLHGVHHAPVLRRAVI